MGSGIAQVAASAGHRVLLRDLDEDAARRAVHGIGRGLDGQVLKKKMTAEAAAGILERIDVVSGGQAGLTSLAECGIVIEAIVEDLQVKRDMFRELEQTVDPGCVLATNTSSLSVTAIASVCERPEQVIGIHFFNPAAILPLVEIVPGLRTSPAVVKNARALVDSWGKTTVLASDTPGFIVNRIARPFYGEAIRIFEERIAEPATIDWAMRDLGGFRMGPFELMDFIGNDINLAATTAVFEGTNFDPRYKPSVTQQRLVEAGRLGRKTGRGHYDYSEGAAKPEPVKDPALGRRILDRILAMLVNEAADAVHYGIGSPADIDLAMTKGVSYPKGLLSWGNEIGLAKIVDRIEALRSEYEEERYRVSPLLTRMVREGLRFQE
jgi:3-hydroxybutyryl-CoA dehydrogenase